jgi:hypothetical protein
MSTSDFVTMQQKRGLKANLPLTAPAGQLLITTDTSELFYGTGTGIAQIGAGSEHQTVYTLFEDNANVYADGMPGTYDPKAREGWYFTNATAGKKINWYFYDPTVVTSTVAQFESVYAVVTLDTNKVPFFVVYTLGTDFLWYKSARVFANQSPATVTPGKYLIYAGTDPGIYPELPRIAQSVTAGASNGAFGAGETIMTMTLHTDSGSSVNSYKFVTHQVGFQTSAASFELNLKIKGDSTRDFYFTTPSATWTVNHNLGKRPSVTVVNNNGTEILGTVRHVNENQITVSFSAALTGAVHLN